MITRRANADYEKSLVMERLLSAWLKVPSMRLGQLLVCAAAQPDIFYVEDYDLTEAAEALAAEYS